MNLTTCANLVGDRVDWPAHLARAIAVAQNVLSAAPNPRVGCVILSSDGLRQVEGWHEAPGLAHAEVMALRNAKAAGMFVEGAIVFVSLEPCAHQGRTGPCAAALVEAGVATVVIASLDPNPKVAGKGVAILETAGIEVVHLTDLELPARDVNLGFFKRFEKGLPFVRLKLAMSLDGRTALANGESKWITGPAARQDVQRMRISASALVTGVGSVVDDNPSMNVRPEDLKLSSEEKARNEVLLTKQPLRVVLDSQLRTPTDAQIYRTATDSGRVVVHTLASAEQQAAYRAAMTETDNVELVSGVANGLQGRERVNLQSVLEYLAQNQCNEVMVEAGATLGGAFIDAGLVDEFVIFMAPKLLGGDGKPLLDIKSLACLSHAPMFDVCSLSQLDQDIKIVLRPKIGTLN
ncbi:MAG: bifunctional diaminohydroxyphosphoribosylaminopyrimidine deaminase/5-amino-6-(5-phosphoribosylamino)uracil reductase RibD [Pseudohongiellaceae bacterium]